MDPGCLTAGVEAGELEVVVPYVTPKTTAAALQRVPALTAGLNVRVLLIAVHTLPYPLPFICPALLHAHLVEELMELAAQCALPVQPEVILARDFAEGLRFAVKPSSTILIATERRFWQTQEERVAHFLARDGHKVALVHIS
jgi:hypothetical protein